MADITGILGSDTLTGTTESDQLFDLYDYGNDWMFGGDGNDVLFSGGGTDYLFGGDGDDVQYGDTGEDYLSGNNGNDFLYGGTEYDYLSGDDGDDYLSGDEGNDILMGGHGDDVLIGGDGNDTLVSGDGNDYLCGGSGVDWFYLNAPDQGIKTIADFSVSEDFIFIPVEFGSSDPNQFIYSNSTGVLLFDTNGSMTDGLMPVAQLASDLAFTSNNIVFCSQG